MDTSLMTNTAVIMAAGRGSRRMPITRAIDKAMIPLGNRPTVDYVVEQCARGGMERIIFIVSDADTLLKKYYHESIRIEDEYPWLEKSGELRFEYIVQKDVDSLYGTGAALLSVEDVVKGKFIVLAADGFLYSEDDYVSHLTAQSQCDGAVIGLVVHGKDAQNYGVIKRNSQGNLKEIIEKPKNVDMLAEYPCYISYALLDDAIFDVIRATPLENNELYLTSAIARWAQEARVAVVPVRGRYLDSGRLEPWIDANRYLFDS